MNKKILFGLIAVIVAATVTLAARIFLPSAPDYNIIKLTASEYALDADAGDSDAQFKLGLCYYLGEGGVKEDYQTAIKWFKRSDENGNIFAKCYISECYYFGDNTIKTDSIKANKLFKESLSVIKSEANKGNSFAQYCLGGYYEYGTGVEQDYAVAVEWYRKAAKQGNAWAQCNLGWCYANGNGVEQDYAVAVEWYRKAAEQGYAWAQNDLGFLYLDGEGVGQNTALGIEWLKKAAEQGNASIQYNLGARYYFGDYGIDKDYAVAVEWFRKAAEQGKDWAQYYLGWCYEHGNSVERNTAMAIKWYKEVVANKDGDETVKKYAHWGLKRLNAE